VANIFVAASATWNGKALKKAKQDVSVFDKQVKKLGGTLAAAFSARSIIRFGKEAVKAFMADEKAAKSLEQQLKNTGFQFSSPAVELYIANLQKATGVLDDELRPAFQQLLTVTGSITTSQDALNTAMNVSAATGRSLSQVTTALSRAYAGNTTGLSRLGAGLDKALLKTGDMDAIMAELNKKFAGQAQARLTTYAGKMDLLKVASENVKEEIGKGILGALAILGEDTNIEKTTKKMEDLAKQTSDTTIGFGALLKTLGDIPGLGMVGRAFYETSTLGLLARLGRENRPARELPANEQRSAGRITAQQFRVEVRQKKELDKLRALEIAALKKKTAVDELAAKFDVERIGFQKALNEATDEETKLRIKAQLAILDNNEALAKKILAELAAAEATKKFAASFDAALSSVMALTARINAFILKEGGKLPSGGAAGGQISYDTALSVARATNTRIENFLDQFDSSSTAATVMENASVIGPNFDAGRFRMGEERSMQGINITIDTAQTGDRFAQLIAESIQVAGRNGYSTTANGSL
jgi:phage shock protein A